MENEEFKAKIKEEIKEEFKKEFKKIAILCICTSSLYRMEKELKLRIDKIDKFQHQNEKRSSICEPYRKLIVDWYKQNYSSYKIADKLNLSQKTISNYINYLKKEGVI